MAFKVQVGPPQIATHQGQTVLVTDPDGSITWPSEKGLYFLDTRIISHWAIYANGEFIQVQLALEEAETAERRRVEAACSLRRAGGHPRQA